MIEYAGRTLTHILVSDTHKVDSLIAPPEVKVHEHLVSGSGDIDFTAIFRALKGIGYKGFLSVHIISEVDRIVDATEKTKRRLEKLLNIPEL
jgi:sugar phosphate isomerase/epimerase